MWPEELQRPQHAACPRDPMLLLSEVGEVCAGTITHGCAADERTALRVREWLLGAPSRGKVRCVHVGACVHVHGRAMMHVVTQKEERAGRVTRWWCDGL